MDLVTLVKETRRLRDEQQGKLDSMEEQRRSLLDAVRSADAWLSRFDPEAPPVNGNGGRGKRKKGKSAAPDTLRRVFDAVEGAPAEGISQVEISTATGLTTTPVSNALAWLRDHDLVYLAGSRKNRQGQPSNLYKLMKGADRGSI